MSERVTALLNGMCSESALERRQSTQKLESCISTLDAMSVEKICITICTQLNSLCPDNRWQQYSGTLLAAAAVVKYVAALVPHAQRASLAAIAHTEHRVRDAAAALLGAAARADGGVGAWGGVKKLLDVICDRFSIDDDARLDEARRVAARDAPHTRQRNTDIVHETEGWRGLETALLALRGVADGCAAAVFSSAADVDDVAPLGEVLELITRAMSHENRFVREAALRVLEALTRAAPAHLAAEMVIGTLGSLAAGLQDNWSQVRYAASVCARVALVGVPPDTRRSLYDRLLPRLCLNRHYVAEGVRTLSHSTWRDVVGNDGRLFLQANLDLSLAYFESQCRADNHAVREAACQSVAEVTTCLSPAVVCPLVPRALSALTDCAKDESWPVRDHACRAIADVVAAFPAQAEATHRLEQLYGLLHAHLADNIPSVRENCAQALVHSATAFNGEHSVFGMRRVADASRQLMRRAAAQQVHSVVVGDRDRHTGYGAAAKLARDNDVELHSGQIMYSCGSLAPKLRRGGGCMDHGFSRPRQPWEEADGGIRLWRRIANTGGEGAVVAAHSIEDVAQVARMAATTPFAQQAQLAECVWTQIGSAMDSLPKEMWVERQAVAEMLVTAVEMDRKCGHRRVESAAAVAMRGLRKSLGFAGYETARKASA